MKYVYLPLDDRPCTCDFPVQLAAWAGEKVTVPSDIGERDFRTAYPFEKSWAFLEREAEAGARLIIAADQLCYGGLLQSRSMADVDMETALGRLERLRDLKARFPDIQIHVFSVIMRASISTLSQADLRHYHNMTSFCQLSHKAHLSGSEEDRAALEQVRAQLPEALLNHYLAVRERNHQVNLACVRMAQEGVLDSLMLLQEDAQVYGLHRLEQEKLLAAMAEKPSPVFLHNGADEGGAMAVMTAIARDRQHAVSLWVQYLGDGDPDFVAHYEDRPFRENVQSYLRYAGITVCQDAPQALFILSPDMNGQRDMQDDLAEMYTPSRLQDFAGVIAQAADREQRPYLLDVSVANGALPGMLNAVDNAMGLERLWGYSAWNTSCNSLGTVVAHILSDSMAEKRNVCFLWERLLDDCLYEGNIRQQLRRHLQEQGEDAMAIKDKTYALQQLDRIAAEVMAGTDFVRNMPCKAHWSLPWPRTFECRVTCECPETSCLQV